MFDGLDDGEANNSKRQQLKRTGDQADGKKDKKEWVSKGKVDQSKLESKKKYKEAKKRAKLNK